MTSFVAIVLWCLLLLLCWPLALFALIVWPLLWLVTLPLRLVGIGVGAIFTLLADLLFLPARAPGHRR